LKNLRFLWEIFQSQAQTLDGSFVSEIYLLSMYIKMGVQMFVCKPVGMWRANGNPKTCTDLDKILQAHPYLSKKSWGAWNSKTWRTQFWKLFVKQMMLSKLQIDPGSARVPSTGNLHKSQKSLCAKSQLSSFKTVLGDKDDRWATTSNPYWYLWQNFCVNENINLHSIAYEDRINSSVSQSIFYFYGNIVCHHRFLLYHYVALPSSYILVALHP